MRTEIFALRCERELLPEEQVTLMNRLPPERRERLIRARPEKRREVLCAYGLLDMALKLRMGWPEIPKLRKSSRGKPEFAGDPGLHFSLSHTDGAVLAGISASPLGADIEKLRLMPERLLRGYGAETAKAFLESWTRREALAKRRDAAGGLLWEELLPNGDEQLVQTPVFPGYIAAAACAAGEPPLWTYCTLSQLLN